MQKINPDILLMCELHVTVKFYRAACSFHGAGAHFFRIRRIHVRAVCFMTPSLSPGDSGSVHIYTQTIYSTTQSTKTIHRKTQFTNWESCGPCSVFARYTMLSDLQLRKKHGKASVRAVGECQLPG